MKFIENALFDFGDWLELKGHQIKNKIAQRRLDRHINKSI